MRTKVQGINKEHTDQVQELQVKFIIFLFKLFKERMKSDNNGFLIVSLSYILIEYLF